MYNFSTSRVLCLLICAASVLSLPEPALKRSATQGKRRGSSDSKGLTNNAKLLNDIIPKKEGDRDGDNVHILKVDLPFSDTLGPSYGGWDKHESGKTFPTPVIGMNNNTVPVMLIAHWEFNKAYAVGAPGQKHNFVANKSAPTGCVNHSHGLRGR
jgi:hypothetical protein